MKPKKILFILLSFIFILFLYINVSEASEEVSKEIIEETEEKEIGRVKLKASEEDIERRDEKVLYNNKIMLVNENITQEYAQNYYYNQLTNNLSRRIYNALLQDENAEGKIELSINGYIYNVSDFNDDTRRELYNKNLEPYIFDATFTFMEERQERYWWNYEIEFYYTYINHKDSGQIEFSEIELVANCPEKSKKAEFDKKLNNVANSLEGNSVYDIAKSAHDYVCENVKYELVDGTEIEHTAYGALMNNKAVCDGQANLFILLCRKRGLITISISGNAIQSSRKGETSMGICISSR